MKSYFALTLVLLLNCVSCHTIASTPGPVKPIKVEIVKNSIKSQPLKLGRKELVDAIPIFELNGVKVSNDLKRLIYKQLDRFPQSHKMIASVSVTLELFSRGKQLSGLWDGDNIILAYRKKYDMVLTLWHEIGHAMMQGLKPSQRARWKALYLKQYKAAGLSPFDKLKATPQGFPSIYATTSYWEFMAEHVEEATLTPSTYYKRFPLAYRLLKKQKLLARN